MPEYRSLITTETFREMARKGATATDLGNVAVLKHGRIFRKAAADGGDGREIGFILSNSSMDRGGDTVQVTGWDTKDYTNNPVVLWAHDHEDLPVGRALKTYVDGNQLKAIDEFVDKDLYPFAYTVYRMLRAGYLNACSVGFLPTEWEMLDQGVNFTKQTLLEHSVCPVPAHPQALVIARRQGIDVAPLKAWAEKTLDLFARSGDGATIVKSQLERLRVQSDPTGRKLVVALRALQLPEQPSLTIAPVVEAESDEIAVDGEPIIELAVPDDVLVMKGVTPANVSTTLAPEDQAWERPTLGDFTDQAWGDLSEAQKTRIAGHFAWVRVMPPESFGDLSLPHHDPSNGEVVWRGCVAVAGRLNQTRLPSADVAAVKAHMRAHFEAFGKDVPDVLKDLPMPADPTNPNPAPATPPDPQDADLYAAMNDAVVSVGETCANVADTIQTAAANPDTAAGLLASVANECTNASDTLLAVANAAQELASPDEPTEPTAPAPAGPTMPAAPQSVAAPIVGNAAPVFVGKSVAGRRWNPRWTKAFDVDRVQLPTRTVVEALAASYFGVEVKKIERQACSMWGFKVGSWVASIADEIQANEWQIDDLRAIDDQGKEKPPEYTQIQLNSELTNFYLTDGIRFMRRIDSDGVERRVVVAIEPTWSGVFTRVFAVRDTGEASGMMMRLSQRTKENNFLKGEAFSLSGEFIAKTSDGLGDIFLDDKNQKAIERVVRLLNDRGGDMDNRGAIFMGPPGTGKTLAARIIRNVAKSTFIWISSRDFYYAGAFGGITEAYDLARECAPSVLVFEDIDAWLGDTTMDLLKTEMDGVAKSTGVVTILTTNYPEYLPNALLDRPGRFHDVLKFGLPADAVRRAMLKRWLPDADEATLALAVEATKGYSGAHVRELARFAGVLAEQEELGLGAAVVRAIEKLREQRELINQIQTSGSRYRMPEGMVTHGAEVGALTGELREMKPVAGALVTKTTPTASDVHAAYAETLPDLVTLAEELMGMALTSEQKRKVSSARVSLNLAKLAGVRKIGRVLSQANEDRLKRASILLAEVLAQLEAAADPAEDDAKAEPGDTAHKQVEPPAPSVGDPPVTDVPVPVGDPAEEEVTFEDDDDVDLTDNDIREAIAEGIKGIVAEQVMLTTGRLD